MPTNPPIVINQTYQEFLDSIKQGGPFRPPAPQDNPPDSRARQFLQGSADFLRNLGLGLGTLDTQWRTNNPFAPALLSAGQWAGQATAPFTIQHWSQPTTPPTTVPIANTATPSATPGAPTSYTASTGGVDIFGTGAWGGGGAQPQTTPPGGVTRRFVGVTPDGRGIYADEQGNTIVVGQPGSFNAQGPIGAGGGFTGNIPNTQSNQLPPGYTVSQAAAGDVPFGPKPPAATTPGGTTPGGSGGDYNIPPKSPFDQNLDVVRRTVVLDLDRRWGRGMGEKWLNDFPRLHNGLDPIAFYSQAFPNPPQSVLDRATINGENIGEAVNKWRTSQALDAAFNEAVWLPGAVEQWQKLHGGTDIPQEMWEKWWDMSQKGQYSDSQYRPYGVY